MLIYPILKELFLCVEFGENKKDRLSLCFDDIFLTFKSKSSSCLLIELRQKKKK